MRKRLLALRNDVGLLSEEYDPDTQRLIGIIADPPTPRADQTALD